MRQVFFANKFSVRIWNIIIFFSLFEVVEQNHLYLGHYFLPFLEMHLLNDKNVCVDVTMVEVGDFPGQFYRILSHLQNWKSLKYEKKKKICFLIKNIQK